MVIAHQGMPRDSKDKRYKPWPFVGAEMAWQLLLVYFLNIELLYKVHTFSESN